MLKEKVSDKIKVRDIKKWNKGDIITITSGCGSGKSYFVKNVLYQLAKEENKKILFLIHRKNCVEQFTKEIEKDKKEDVIDIKTYQSLESKELNKNKQQIDFSQYSYIVCDEFHYFVSDSAFNINTDVSLDLIININNAVKIFLSATTEIIDKYFKWKGYETISYKFKIDYSFIESLTFFNKDNTMESFIEEAIKNNNKGIFFIQSAKKAYELYKKYEKYCLFNCSSSNLEYYKYVDREKISKMLIEEKFEERILITTTCLDTGVNIIDEDVKHIVCDVQDIYSLIQCIGRRRIQHNKDKIYVYIKSISNKQLGGKETQLKKKLKMADFFRKHTIKEYIEEFPKRYDKTVMVYDVVTEDRDTATKKLNKLMYYKCKYDIADILRMKKFGEYGYCKYLANLFGFKDNYRLIEEENKKDDLEEYLESMVGKVMLMASNRKELIDILDVKSNRKQLKRINNLNGALEEMQLPYRIVEFETSRIIDGKKKKYKNAWKVEKLIS